MQIVLAAVLVGLAHGRTATDTLQRIPCQDVKKLWYDYRMVAYNGIPGTSTNISGIETNMTLSMKAFVESNRIELQIEDCSSAPLYNLSAKRLELCDQLKHWPLLFDKIDGRIVDIYPDSEESELVLNLKRGIISAFQVGLSGEDNTRVIDEVDVLGKCPTEIIESHLEDEIEILKHRETEKCEGRPKHTIISQSQNQEAQFAYGTMTATYRLNKGGQILLAELIQDEELAPLTKEAGHILTHINQTLWLVRSEDSCDQPRSLANRVVSSLPLKYNVETEYDPAGQLVVETIIDGIVKANLKDIPQLFIELIPAIQKLNLDKLREVKSNLAENKLSVFLDALPFTYTEAALELIVELTHPDYPLNHARQTALTLSLAAAPVDSANPCALLAYAQTVAKNRGNCESSTLVLGTVINRVREYNPRICNYEVDLAIKYLTTKAATNVKRLPLDYNPLENSDHAQYKTEWEQVLHAIKALGNAGIPESITVLRKYINEKRLLTEGRTAAISALQRIAKKSPLRVRELTVQLYHTLTLENEIRIAAFIMYMESALYGSSPSYQMRRVLEQVTREQENSEVQSYVCSYLKSLRQTQDPTYRKLRSSLFYYEQWTNALKTCDNSSHSVFSSHSFLWYKSMADVVKPLSRDSMGASLSLDYVSTNASRIPRSVKGKLSAHLFGYDLNILEAGIRTTGIEKLLCSMLLGSEGYLRLGSLAEEVYDFLCGSHNENTSASVYLKAMGDEVLWKNFRPNTNLSKVDTVRNRVINFFTKAGSLRREMSSLIELLSSGQYPLYNESVHVNKTAGVLDIRRVIPTIVGMPINLNVAAAGHVQLDLATEMKYINEHPIWSALGYDTEDMVEACVKINPKLSVAAKVEVLLDDYQYKPKLVFFANASSNFSQSISAKLYSNYTTNITIHKMPENETMLLNASYIQFAVVNGKSQQLRVENQKKKSAYINAYDLVGLDLLANISYASRSGHPVASLLPPAGPANLTVTLRRPNANLSALIFTLKKSDLTLKSFSVNATLVAVGINRSINSSLAWKVEKKSFLLNGSLSCALANSSVLVLVNTSHPFTIDSHVTFNSSLANFTVGIGLNSTNVNANSSLVVGKHRIYQAELNTSRQSFQQGNLSFNLFIQEQKLPHSLTMNLVLRKWYANLTGQLLLSGKSEPHQVVIGGSFGKYYANFTGLFEMAGHCAPYKMAFNGSYLKGNVSSWAMLDLPDILKRQDVYVKATVGKWFADSYAAIYQVGRKLPHRIHATGNVNKGLVNMSASLLKAGQNDPHYLLLESKLSKWSIKSVLLLKRVNKTVNKLRITGTFAKGQVTGNATFDALDLFKLYNESKLPSNKVKRVLAKISNALHQPSDRPHQVWINGTLNKWYSDVSATVHLARDKLPHYLNFNGSFAKWYINGTLLLLPKGQSVPHIIHLSGNMGKWFLNGSVFFHNASYSRPYRIDLNGSVGKLWIDTNVSYHHAPDERPYRVCLNGSVGKLWVNASSCFQLPRDKKPHHATLKGIVGKWFVNVSSTADLQINSSIWDKNYLYLNLSLAGKAIRISTNSSLLGLANVRRVLRLDGTITEPQCQVLKKRLKTSMLSKRCRSDKKYPVCSDGCEAVYDSAHEQLVTFRCSDHDEKFDYKLENKSPVYLPVELFVGCKRKL